MPPRPARLVLLRISPAASGGGGIHSPHHVSQIHLLLIIPPRFCIGYLPNRLEDGTRNPTIFAVSQAFKGNPSPTCAVTMNTAAPSMMYYSPERCLYTMRIFAQAVPILLPVLAAAHSRVLFLLLSPSRRLSPALLPPTPNCARRHDAQQCRA